MSEVKESFSSVIREVAKKWEVTPEFAESLLASYTANKNSILKYTTEDLRGLRTVLKIDSDRGLFWNTEIVALKNIVRTQVTQIVWWNDPKPNLVKSSNDKNAEFWAIPPIKEVMLAQKNYKNNQHQINPVIDQVAPIVNVKKETVLAVCAQESRFDPKATSRAGAQGVMQVMPKTFAGINGFLQKGKIINAWSEEKYYAQVRDIAKKQGVNINELIASSTQVWKNIAIGTIYLWYLIEKYGDIEGLRRYNGAKGWSLENRSYVRGITAWKNLIAASNLSTDTIS